MHHRRQLKLRPIDAMISRLLDLCRLVLPIRQAQMVSRVWHLAHGSLVKEVGKLRGAGESLEWVAYMTTLFVFVIHLIDEKARAALNLSQVAARNTAALGSGSLQLGKHQQTLRLSKRTPWSWLDEHASPSDSLNLTSLSEISEQRTQKDRSLIIATALADELVRSEMLGTKAEETLALPLSDTVKLMLALHIFSEEQKLCSFRSRGGRTPGHRRTAWQLAWSTFLESPVRCVLQPGRCQ